MILRLVKWLIVVMFIGVVALVFFSFRLARPHFEDRLDGDPLASVSIASTSEAITLARTTSGEVILVTGADASGIRGIDLAHAKVGKFADARDAFDQLGHEALVRASEFEDRRFRWNLIGMPIDEEYPHIAAGTNFKDHAEEVGHEDEPFLFPKLSHATAWNANVSNASRLDHEVELCAIPLEDHEAGSSTQLGYLLCGDFTDRFRLVMEIDLDQKMGTTGFPEGKGGATRLPIGPFLVIPKSADFYRSIELRLFVNDRLRQRAQAGLMIWPPEEILARALADCETPYWIRDATVKISDCEKTAAGTLLLTGTPGGVMFHPATLWNPRAYLREGDVVTSIATYLGVMQNRIGDVGELDSEEKRETQTN